MKNPWLGSPLLLEVLVAPNAACARVQRAPRILGPWLVLAIASVAVQIAGLAVLEPAARADALLADTLGGPGDATGLFRAAGVGVALLAPWMILLRAGFLALSLDAAAAMLGRGRTGRSLWAWLVGLEVVLWIEQAASVTALAFDPPSTLAVLQDHGLQAGIGLFVEFESPWLAAVAKAANVFTLWWGALLGVGLVRVGRFRPATATGLATACWIAVIGMRTLDAWR